MSLNKLTNAQVGIDLGLEIGCSSIECTQVVTQIITMPPGGEIDACCVKVSDTFEVTGTEAKIGGVDFVATNTAMTDQVLRADGLGGSYWDDVSGGGGGTETLQEGYNVSSQPQIVTSDVAGKLALELKKGGTGDALLQLKDSGDNINLKLNASGLVEAKTLCLAAIDDHIELKDDTAKRWTIKSNNADADKFVISDESDVDKLVINQGGSVEISDALLGSAKTTGSFEIQNPSFVKKWSLSNGAADAFEIQNGADTAQLSISQTGITTIKNVQIGSPGVEYKLTSARGLTGQVLTYDDSINIGRWEDPVAGGSTLQEAYDASSAPQMLTTVADPVLVVKKGVGVAGVNILQVQDESGATVLGVDSDKVTVAQQMSTTGLLTDDVGEKTAAAGVTIQKSRMYDSPYGPGGAIGTSDLYLKALNGSNYQLEVYSFNTVGGTSGFGVYDEVNAANVFEFASDDTSNYFYNQDRRGNDTFQFTDSDASINGLNGAPRFYANWSGSSGFLKLTAGNNTEYLSANASTGIFEFKNSAGTNLLRSNSSLGTFQLQTVNGAEYLFVNGGGGILSLKNTNGSEIFSVSGATSSVIMRDLKIDMGTTPATKYTLPATATGVADGSVLVFDSTTRDMTFRPQTPYVLYFGGEMDITGKFARANGDSTTVTDTTLNATKQLVIVSDGELVGISYSAPVANASSVLQLWLNGVASSSVTCTGPIGFTDFSSPIAVSKGDRVAIKSVIGDFSASTFSLYGRM
jgi:hypothetical protein